MAALEDKAIWEDGEVILPLPFLVEMLKLLRITFRILSYCLICFFFYFSKEMDEEVLRMQTDEIVSRARLLDNEIKVRSFEDLTGNSRLSLFLSYV